MSRSAFVRNLLASALLVGCSASAISAEKKVVPAPWESQQLNPDKRAELLLAAMTTEEKLTLVFGYFGSDIPGKYTRHPDSRWASAGFIPGIPRLGIPSQWQTDAGIGVSTQRDTTVWRERTALPSGIATTATWDLDLAYKGGAMIGGEARNSGFNVMLAGGVNLLREPRNGRNFEYGGEDPLLAGYMVGAQIKGIQSNHIVSTIKHYALNDQETGRHFVSANIDHDQARMSDLLAFQYAIERSEPGAVMCAYNRVDGDYSCENDWLLNQVLKKDWGYKGYVLSDWGGVHSTVKAANNGLDQQSAGHAFDKAPYFKEPLAAAVKSGEVSGARLNDMVRRILRSFFAAGVMDAPPVADNPIDLEKNGKVSQADAEASMVLLKNEGGLLPMTKTARSIAVIGSHADVGVLSGGGSSQVYPAGGMAIKGLGPKDFPGPMVFHPSSPLKALQAKLPGTNIQYDDGTDPARAAKLAASSDIAIVFANQWTAEQIDASLTLPDNQDATISAVAEANKQTIVVLETGGPVLMPWLSKVPAVLEAWYPGTNGGQAIARVLLGEVDVSGRLPVTFPAAVDQLPHPVLADNGGKPEQPFDVNYHEGATVGYKWYDSKKLAPLFPFGYGLSYTKFAFSNLRVSNKAGKVTASFSVKNIGDRSGKATPQIYVGPKDGASGWEAPRRLGGWSKVELAPGAQKRLSVTIEPRLLAVYKGGWQVKGGSYVISLGHSSRELVETAEFDLSPRKLTNVR